MKILVTVPLTEEERIELQSKMPGAALDVTDPEPLPADHPLWKCENLLLTPHVAGGYHMQETLRRIIRLIIDNLGRYAAGEEPRGVVRR